jgi:hypothetical protein
VHEGDGGLTAGAGAVSDEAAGRKLDRGRWMGSEGAG